MLNNYVKLPVRVLILAFLIPSLLYAVSPPLVFDTMVDYRNNQITIHGAHFSPSGQPPSVTFDNSALTLISFTNQTIVASLPSRPAGTYRLAITNPNLPGTPGDFDVTIGAAGPSGPAGATGPQGFA